MGMELLSAGSTAAETHFPAAGTKAAQAAVASAEVESSESSTATTSLPQDRATLSGAGEANSTGNASLQALTVEIMSAESSRAGRVEALRTAVSTGSYSIDPEAVAEAMIGESL